MTSYEQFLIFIDRILSNEGGYVNDPQDPGGETNWGISKRSYPQEDIKNLTRDEAISIYWRDFYVVLGADQMAPAIGYQLLDSAINSGITPTIRLLQRALGVADDGVFGPVSRKALAQASESDIVMKFVAHRLDYMTRLKNWPVHGKGWTRRMAQNLLYGSVDTD